jgi:hypothetical protein
LSTKGEAEVVFKGLIAAASAVALSVTPAIAAANGSAAAARAASVAAPADETVEGESELFGRGGFIIPLLVIIVIIIGIYIAVDDGEDGPPASP